MEHPSPRTSLQILSLGLGTSGNSLEGKEVKKQTIPSKDETFKYWSPFFFFFLAELLFPNSHRGLTAQEQIKQLQKGIYFCSGPDCTQSNLHNLPPNLNQLKCTPGDYIQKPIWKNIHCLTLKNPGERKQSGRGCSSWKERSKKKQQK